jgi:hypothetical protein
MSIYYSCLFMYFVMSELVPVIHDFLLPAQQ